MRSITAILLYFALCCSVEAKGNIAKITVRSDYLSIKDTLEIFVWDDLIGSRYVAPFRQIQAVWQEGQYVFEIGNIRSSTIASLCFSYQKLKGIPAYCIFDQIRLYEGDEIYIELTPQKGIYSPSEGYDDTGLPMYKNNWSCHFYKGTGAERMALEHRVNMLIDMDVPYNTQVGNNAYDQMNYQLQQHNEKWGNIQQLIHEDKGNISSLARRQLYWDCLGKVRLLQMGILKKNNALLSDDARVQSSVRGFLDSLRKEIFPLMVQEDIQAAQSPTVIQYLSDFFVLFTRVKTGARPILKPTIKYVEETFSSGKIRDRLLTNLMIDRFISYPDTKLLEELLLTVTDSVSQKRLEGLAVLLKGKPFPQFDLPDISGKRYTLSDLKGKNVLIDFWYMGCIPCRAYMENVIRPLCETYSEADNVQVVLISLDDRKTLEKAVESGIVPPNALPLYTDNLKFRYPLLNVLGIKSYPFPILLDTNGHIIVSGQALKTIEGIRKYLLP